MKQSQYAKCFDIFNANPGLTRAQAIDAAIRAGITPSNAPIEHQHWYYAGCGRFGPGDTDPALHKRNCPGDERTVNEKAEALMQQYRDRGGYSMRDCYALLRDAGFGAAAAYNPVVYKFPARDAIDPYSTAVFG